MVNVNRLLAPLQPAIAKLIAQRAEMVRNDGEVERIKGGAIAERHTVDNRHNIRRARAAVNDDARVTENEFQNNLNNISVSIGDVIQTMCGESEHGFVLERDQRIVALALAQIRSNILNNIAKHLIMDHNARTARYERTALNVSGARMPSPNGVTGINKGCVPCIPRSLESSQIQYQKQI